AECYVVNCLDDGDAEVVAGVHASSITAWLRRGAAEPDGVYGEFRKAFEAATQSFIAPYLERPEPPTLEDFQRLPGWNDRTPSARRFRGMIRRSLRTTPPPAK